MKILIEGSAVLKDRSGVGQYSKRLIEAMAKRQPKNNYTLFGFRLYGKPLPKPVFNEDLGISYRFIRFIPGRGYNLLRKLGIAPPIDLILRLRPDVIFFPNFVRWPVLSKQAKTIVAVYDLSFINFGQFTQPKNLKYMLKFVAPSIKKADHIVTISENSKREIIEHYSVDPEKISIIYPAISPDEFFPRPVKDIMAVRQKYNLPNKYILYMGTIEPRKNINGILEAYEDLGEDLQKIHPMVLAGGRGWKDELINEKIGLMRSAGKQIITTGYVPDEDLPAIYSGASLFVYPSFYEGFGIPPLEAMACGVPVITSDNSSLPEVVGKSALMVKAQDKTGLVTAMTSVLRDKKLADKYRLAGLARAKKFSWDTSAKSMLKLMESLK